MIFEENSILVDIDCLFDTRLATLKGLKDEYVSAILKANYRDRITDNLVELLPELDMKAYHDLYRARDIPTWVTAGAYPTLLPIHLSLIVREHIKIASEGPLSGLPIVTINTYPYALTPEEKNELTKRLHSDIGEPLCKVVTVRLSPEQMSPSILKNQYKVIFIYSLSEWMTLHENDIRATAPIDIVVFAPKLFTTGNLNSHSDFSQYKDINLGVLATELHMQYFRLELLEASWFSYLDVRRLAEIALANKKI